MTFEHYIRSDGKNLRMGYTTGTCAALAAAGAAEALLTGHFPKVLSLMTPKGIEVFVRPEECCLSGGQKSTGRAESRADERRVTGKADSQAGGQKSEWARCGVRKDAGDDADVTDGLLIMAQAERCDLTSAPDGACHDRGHSDLHGEAGRELRSKTYNSERVRILGGEGIGRVTKPGLDQKVGEAAINRVPRQLIRREVLRVCEEQGYEGGITITIYAPDGEAAAKKTLNERLGIEGGISIIGTSGIVEPMSMKAYADSVRLEIRQAAAQVSEIYSETVGTHGKSQAAAELLGNRKAAARIREIEKSRKGMIILTPGNYGLSYLEQNGKDIPDAPVVVCSNFIGDAVDEAVSCGFGRIILVGHAGKLVKLAAGIMNTHSSVADGRTEIFTAHAAVNGASEETCRRLMDAVTTDACISILMEEGLAEKVLCSIRDMALDHLRRRCAGISCDIIMFSNEYGELGR